MSSFGSYEVKSFSVGFRTTVIIIIEVKGIMIQLWSILKCLIFFFIIKLPYTSSWLNDPLQK